MNNSNLSLVPDVAPQTPHLVVGSVYLSVGLVFLVMYIVALVALACDKELISLSVYKIMFAAGVMDLLVNISNGVVAGIFCINGSTYGEVNAKFWAALLNHGWFSACFLNVLLAFNRFIVVWRKDLRRVFEGRKVYIWMSVALAAGALTNTLAEVEGLLYYDAKLCVYLFSSEFGVYIGMVTSLGNHLLASVFSLGVVVKLVLLKLKLAGAGDVKKTDLTAIYQMFIICGGQITFDIQYNVLTLFNSLAANVVANAIGIATIGLTPTVLFVFNRSVRKAVLRFLPRQRYDEVQSMAINKTSNSPAFLSSNRGSSVATQGQSEK